MLWQKCEIVYEKDIKTHNMIMSKKNETDLNDEGTVANAESERKQRSVKTYFLLK